MGSKFLRHMKGEKSGVFNVPSINTLQDLMTDVTGLPTSTSPGLLPVMIGEAKRAFGDKPLNLSFDERMVSSNRSILILKHHLHRSDDSSTSLHGHSLVSSFFSFHRNDS